MAKVIGAGRRCRVFQTLQALRFWRGGDTLNFVIPRLRDRRYKTSGASLARYHSRACGIAIFSQPVIPAQVEKTSL